MIVEPILGRHNHSQIDFLFDLHLDQRPAIQKRLEWGEMYMFVSYYTIFNIEIIASQFGPSSATVSHHQMAGGCRLRIPFASR